MTVFRLMTADPGVVQPYLVAVVGPPVVQVVAHRSYQQGELLQAAQVWVWQMLQFARQGGASLVQLSNL